MAVLVGGALNALLGILGTVLRFAIVGGSVQKTHGVEHSLLAGGIKGSLCPAIFGLPMLTVAIVVWLASQISTWRRKGHAPA